MSSRMQNYIKSFSPKGKGVDVNEISFAKQFLTSADQKPLKLSADHVEDPRKLPAQPAYILPKMPTTMPPPGSHPSDPSSPLDASTSTPTPTPSKLTANLRTLRPASTLTLPSLDPSTSIHALKTSFAAQSGTGASVDKIKILFRKKPVADSKTLAECAEPGSADVDFSVMVVGGTPGAGGAGGGGGGATTPGAGRGASAGAAEKADPMESVPAPASAPEVVMGEGGEGAGASTAVLRSEEFWTDLRGWLGMRLKDAEEGERLVGIFRGALGER
ncbi:hypothetical protein EV356DRAFT_528937 [Viridothelium virens]|uniref:Ubiquitin-like domain-containing protein n=1 Tax=Viridothelium virens TaxID=1048519 RepID=A0A6A6HK04_VIRVR|nr:hypothetical protein EV356DRAFT_528937 [Viridothelium virens]